MNHWTALSNYGPTSSRQTAYVRLHIPSFFRSWHCQESENQQCHGHSSVCNLLRDNFTNDNWSYAFGECSRLFSDVIELCLSILRRNKFMNRYVRLYADKGPIDPCL